MFQRRAKCEARI